MCFYRYFIDKDDNIDRCEDQLIRQAYIWTLRKITLTLFRFNTIISYKEEINSSENNYNENSKGKFTLDKSKIPKFINKIKSKDGKKYAGTKYGGDDDKFSEIIGYRFTFYDLGEACQKDTSFSCI